MLNCATEVTGTLHFLEVHDSTEYRARLRNTHAVAIAHDSFAFSSDPFARTFSYIVDQATKSVTDQLLRQWQEIKKWISRRNLAWAFVCSKLKHICERNSEGYHLEMNLYLYLAGRTAPSISAILVSFATNSHDVLI